MALLQIYRCMRRLTVIRLQSAVPRQMQLSAECHFLIMAPTDQRSGTIPWAIAEGRRLSGDVQKEASSRSVPDTQHANDWCIKYNLPSEQGNCAAEPATLALTHSLVLISSCFLDPKWRPVTSSGNLLSCEVPAEAAAMATRERNIATDGPSVRGCVRVCVWEAREGETERQGWDGAARGQSNLTEIGTGDPSPRPCGDAAVIE
ncbi:hypothetical protein NQZ68_025690 [Dissostichus eleginoides]|nr:hypothetical protein NQZ68_025690 [Dissostichus eleginoides]